MKKIEPTIFKTKAWKWLEKEIGKPPKLSVYPLDRDSKEDKKKAKLMEQIVNYQFKTNYNGFTDKYWAYMKKHAEKYLRKETQAIQVNWESVDKVLNNMQKEDK
jgi:hypothetical protein